MAFTMRRILLLPLYLRKCSALSRRLSGRPSLTFVAFFLFKDHGVANTIAKTVNADSITLQVVLSGLIAAIIWNLFTWWRGIPSSSSHTLIGGFLGAAMIHSSYHAVNWYTAGKPGELPSGVLVIIAFIVLAPVMGMIMAYIIAQWFLHSFRATLWPKLVSLAVIVAVFFSLSTAIVTETSRIVGLKFDKEYTGKGLKVSDVFTSSPAQIMGLKKGDVIVATDGQVLQDKRQMDALMRTHATDANITFNILRKDKEQTITSSYHTSHDSRFWDTVFYGENLKWLIVALIVLTMATATLFLSRLNYGMGTLVLKRLQLVSSAAFSIGHGGNDAQKVMGIIMAALVAYDPEELSPGSYGNLGATGLLWRDLARYAQRWLEDHQDHGLTDHQSNAIRRGCRGNGRRHYSVHNGTTEDSGEHHAYHYRFHHRGWRHKTLIGGSLGRYHQPALGLDTDHSSKRGDRDDRLLYHSPDHEIEQAIVHYFYGISFGIAIWLLLDWNRLVFRFFN